MIRLNAIVVGVSVSASVAALAQEVPYGVGSWPEGERGNHRAIVRVDKPAEAVRAYIPWRRRDPDPQGKDIRVFDAATGKRVMNVARITVNRDYGDIVFQPATVPGNYEVYYMPCTAAGDYFQDAGTYVKPQNTADVAWLDRHKLKAEAIASGQWKSLPRAETVAIQARREFHRFDPMEVVATRMEVEALLAAHPGRSYVLFPEDREHAIRMPDDLPLRWTTLGLRQDFEGHAQPGEYYVFQIGVFAAREPIADLSVEFGDLRNALGAVLPAGELTCFNLGGTDWLGRPIRKPFELGAGQIRALWIGVQIPVDSTGVYSGSLRVVPKGHQPSILKIRLCVSGPLLADAGDGELRRLSRLRWLNSTLGLDDQVIPPFTPLEVQGNTVRLLGRQIEFGACGLPSSIRSGGREVLRGPMALTVETSSGTAAWAAGSQQDVARSPAIVTRRYNAVSEPFALATTTRTESDGCVEMVCSMTARSDGNLKDIRLEVPIRRDVARYLMGMGQRGGLRRGNLTWKWDIEKADNLLWVGDVDAGLQLKLQGEKEVWDTITLKTAGIPASWSNGGRGGCTLTEENDTVWVRAFSGHRAVKAGEKVEFRFRLLITPFKPIDRGHWNWRYGDPSGDANILHVHHATWENPYINYPFLTADRLAQTVRNVKAMRFTQRDFGRLEYPAQGNIRLDRGALHLWTKILFDPKAGQAQQARFNQNLFELVFPNQDAVGYYWNVDDRGMRCYVRQGDPSKNQYPALMPSSSPEWEKGQTHLLTLSWGDRLAIFVDGKMRASQPLKGLLATPLKDTVLRLEGAGFSLNGVKVMDAPYEEGQPVTRTADAHTLLLDTFSTIESNSRTRPERIAASAMGSLTGVCNLSPADTGRWVEFSSRRVESGPKGVNVYYTVRELSNWVAEMWPLRSLGDEVFVTGEQYVYSVQKSEMVKAGGGYPWLQEHLVGGYVPAWRALLPDGTIDAAIGTQGLSRWHNYYVEGLKWLMNATGVDGLYLDGIGYDREIMKRVAKVMQRTNPSYRINFHSGNDYDFMDRHVSAANHYMEHFPYISNLWFGEMYDYNRSPDYWLVEISGIPFGLTSEMLNYENGGNPYRGMIYGMTGRQHPSAAAMWRFWDEFGIQEAEMLGYWNPACPVKTNDPTVLASVYRKKDKSLISLAHWPQEKGTRTANVRATPRPPTIDGRLSDKEYDEAARLTNLTLLSSDSLAAEQTEAYVTRDEQYLYLGFRCVQKAPPVANARSRDGQVFLDDAVEIFIRPDPAKARYVQFVGNSQGVFLDGEGLENRWNAPWEYKASVGSGHWEGEVRVPFAALGITPPKGGQEIGFNLCRDQQAPGRQLSCWSAVNSSFHDVNGFGRLSFSTSDPSTREESVSGKATGIRALLKIDWHAIGLDPPKVRLIAPVIAHFQAGAEFGVNDAIPIEPTKGWLLILEGR